MKRITKIRIPKGEHCGKCKFNVNNVCQLYKQSLWRSAEIIHKNTPERNIRYCKKFYPNGAVFELKEKK